ncbi:MAG: glycosyltransferase [Solirubrobacteraceae bacterium]
MAVTATIIIPTRGRPDYLAVTLASVAPQARAASAEVVVVDDGRDARAEALATANGARYVALGSPRGLNAARNAGLEAARAELTILLDDDVEVDPGWLAAYLDAAASTPEVGVFTGPIRARLEGRAARRRTCGREDPPITQMDLGTADREVMQAWGANLAIRRTALALAGRFDEAAPVGAGDEEEWEERYRARGGRIRYVGLAGLAHRRAAGDASLPALSRAAFRRGFTARRFDARRGVAPSLPAELRSFTGCLWHTIRRRCWNGPVMAAHSAGRIAAALGPQRKPPATDVELDFLSGESGTIGGRRDLLRALGDGTFDALALPCRIALTRAARHDPPTRKILVITATRPMHGATYDRAVSELRRSRHTLTVAARDAGVLGRFANLNGLLAEHRIEGYDWLLLLDDDVVLPRGFLDGLIHQAERNELVLAAPAHRLRSHAAWRVTRRRPLSAVRETAFVEIGPVTALHRQTFTKLLPFPQLRMGWGLDAHWSALARLEGWRIGIVDVLPIAHRAGPAAAAYSRGDAIAEARSFLAEHPYLPASELQRTLAVHRRCA